MKNGMLGLISSTAWKLFSQPVTRGVYADQSNSEWMFSSVKFAGHGGVFLSCLEDVWVASEKSVGLVLQSGFFKSMS